MTTTEKVLNQVHNQPSMDVKENDQPGNNISTSIQDIEESLKGLDLENSSSANRTDQNILSDQKSQENIHLKENESPSENSENSPSTPSSIDQQPLSPENCTLYVRDLDQLVSEAHLFKIFSIYGTIKSIRVIKDNQTKRSLGYAFVNYTSPEYAQNALRDSEINPKVIKNRVCRVLPFQRDANRRYENGNSTIANSPSDTNIFIKNLDPSIESAALYETFSVFGKILSCKIATDEYGIPKGFAYISFEDKDSAQAAIDRMNGVLMNDREVFVGFHIPKWERLNRLNQTYTNLFVKNIDSQVTESEFNDLFSPYGEIDSISLPLNNDGLCRGYGFVNFRNHDDAVKALEGLNDSLLHNRHIYVNRAQKKHEREEELRREHSANALAAAVAISGGTDHSLSLQKHYQGVNLYVKYLNKSLDDEGLKKAFSPFGTITSAKIMTDDTGTSRGFGFVCYSSPQEAQDAIASMHEQNFQGNKLYVALAMRKDTRNKMMFLPPLGASPHGQFGYLPPQYPGQMPGQLSFIPLAAAAAAAAAANGSNTSNQGLPPPGTVSAATAAAFTQRQFNPLPPFYYPLAAAAVAANGPGNPFPIPTGGPAFPPPNGIPGTVSPYGPSYRNNSNFTSNNPGSPNAINRSRSSTPLGRANGLRNANGFKINGNNNINYGNNQSISPASSTSSASTVGTRNNKYSKSGSKDREQYGSSLSAAIASAANPEAEKQVIGEAIYPYALNHHLIHGDSQLAGKITGMLLEQDKNELLKWVDDEPILNRRIQQAFEAYDEFIKKSGPESTA